MFHFKLRLDIGYEGSVGNIGDNFQQEGIRIGEKVFISNKTLLLAARTMAVIYGITHGRLDIIQLAMSII